jgi:hypothetical protein
VITDNQGVGKKQDNIFVSKMIISQYSVAHAYNPSYLGGSGQ